MSRLLARTADRVARAQLRAAGLRHRYVPTEHGAVHLLDGPGRGSSPPVLVIHGLAACAGDEAGFLAGLTHHAKRVYAVDLPGHGRSASPPGGSLRAGEGMLAEVLTAIGGEPLVIIGNSLGGLAALRLAARIPDRVRGLYLLAPGGAPMSADEYDAVIGTLSRAGRPVLRDYVQRAIVRGPPFYGHIAGRVLEARLRRPGLRAALEAARPDDLLDASELTAVTQPVQILWGTEERILPRSGHRFFQTHLPHARVDIVEGLGHAPHRQAPKVVLPRIARFLHGLR